MNFQEFLLVLWDSFIGNIIEYTLFIAPFFCNILAVVQKKVSSHTDSGNATRHNPSFSARFEAYDCNSVDIRCNGRYTTVFKIKRLYLFV